MLTDKIGEREEIRVNKKGHEFELGDMEIFMYMKVCFTQHSSKTNLLYSVIAIAQLLNVCRFITLGQCPFCFC